MSNDYMGSELTPAFALANSPAAVRALLQSVMGAGARPASMTQAESEDLDAFRIQLAEKNVEARRLAINGGVAGIVQKRRVEAAWLHANIHAQGNQ